MHTKNIFFIVLLFFNDTMSQSLSSFLPISMQEVKNLKKKTIENVVKEQLLEHLSYPNMQNMVRLFRIYCIVAWIWHFLSSLKTIDFLLRSQKTEKLGLVLLKNRYKKFNKFNNKFLSPILNPVIFFFQKTRYP